MTDGVPEAGVYVQPSIVAMLGQTPVMHDETFAPLMYVTSYEDFDEVIESHNAVPQGL